MSHSTTETYKMKREILNYSGKILCKKKSTEIPCKAAVHPL